jgi:hypothetical protein
MQKKNTHAAAKAFKSVQKKYGLTDPAMIQKRIIFVNLMALIKQIVEDTPANRKLLNGFNSDWQMAEQARIRTP